MTVMLEYYRPVAASGRKYAEPCRDTYIVKDMGM